MFAFALFMLCVSNKTNSIGSISIY